MFRLFLRVALRDLIKNRMSTLINLIGMAIAFAACVMTFNQIDFRFSQDTFHTNADRIYQIGNVITHNGNDVTWSATPVPLGPTIEQKCPSVEAVSRISVKRVTMLTDEDAFRERVYFVDPDFLDMFDFPLVAGNEAALSDINSIMITEEMAKKYFGDANPIGKELRLRNSNNQKATVIVGAVLKNIPVKSSMQFNFLLPFENLQRWQLLPLDNWEHWTTATFIEMVPGQSPEQLHSQLAPYLTMQQEVNGDWGVSRLVFHNLLDVTHKEIPIRNNILRTIETTALVSLSAIAIILILLAGFNYANNRIVSLARRFREIGIRKVIGSNRRMLITQFIGENVFFIMIALGAGLLLAQFILIPGAMQLVTGGAEGFELHITPRIFLFLAAVVLITSLGAGAYPAYIASRFSPVEVFKQGARHRGGSFFTRIMIGLQFAITFVAILVPVVFAMNARYQMDLDWGYDQEGVLCIPVQNGRNYELMHNALLQYPGIVSMAGSRDQIAMFIDVESVEVDGVSEETHAMQIGPGYLETMGLRIMEGRTFGREYRTDQADEIIVNEAFLKEHNWQTSYDKEVRINKEPYRVIGVLSDFHSADFDNAIAPMVLRITAPENMRYISVRLPKGELANHAVEIKKVFRATFPDLPYGGYFQDEAFDGFFRSNMTILGIFVFAGSAALLIAVMGLFSLVSATIHNREKEIGVRKVLGATVSQVVGLISKPMAGILTVGILISLYPGAKLLKMILDHFYAYHVDISATPFVFASLLVLVVSGATILMQSIRAAWANPIDAIRNE